MSPTSSQQWTRRIRYSDQHLRVSDAERNAVAERLASHYSDGRLDQAEFDERVGRAMSAKTRGDLDGLFDDLPDSGPASAPGNGEAVPYRRRRGRGLGRTILLIVLALVALSIVGHVIAAVTFFAFVVPWFWIAALAVVVLLATQCSRRRHHDR
jgi:hypothetical protein